MDMDMLIPLVCLLLLIPTNGDESSDPISSPCCMKKTVGSVPYTLVDEVDTSDYNCVSNCVYERDDIPGGRRFCFKEGYLEVVCNEDSTTSLPTTKSTQDPTSIVAGILIAGGLNSIASRNIEIFLPSTGKHCTFDGHTSFPNMPKSNLPQPRFFHTLDTIIDGTGVLCGGGGQFMGAEKTCLKFSQSEGNWSLYANLRERRYAHTSWVSPAGLVLMGGIYSGTTTEIVNGGLSFTLNHNSSFACSIQAVNFTIITGGSPHTLKDVFKYNLQGLVEILPSLLQGRSSHGCGSYYDGDEMTLVVAGGLIGRSSLMSTEVHKVGSSVWIHGAPLPGVVSGLAYANFDREIIMMGGANHTQTLFEIMSYNGIGNWTEIGKLERPRSNAAATKIMVNTTECKIITHRE